MPKTHDLDGTKLLMGALARQPPKLHDEMKLGRSKPKPVKSPAKNQPREPSAKPKTA
jgi:hypothetical protein